MIKSIYKNVKIILLVLLIILSTTLFNKDNVKLFAKGQNNSSCEVVMELQTGRILHASNECKRAYMASTTKILTSICVIENTDINKLVKVNKDTVGIEGSSIYLEEGEILSIKDLLYGLMLRSGNDCAETLAIETSGSIEEFAKLMNQTAIRIGATNSNFVNPHGLHDDNHYTTAYDLALISCYALKNNVFREIVSTKSIDIPWSTRNYCRHLINKNKMLSRLDGATGIKTGYTKKAGRCLVTSCKRNNMEIVSVVLNCYDMWDRSEYLINNAFNNYTQYKVIESDHIIDFIDVNNKKVGIYVKNDVLIPVIENEIKKIHLEICPNINNKSIKKDSEIGLAKIYIENNLIFEEKIYNIIDI
ncbi:MAG: D-alanyl-D-alanine carboxypeptidase [Clostridia bacterium]|nr:D-alanyl-D-alanine carboxypeptidase [Clostridia bacterium]